MGEVLIEREAELDAIGEAVATARAGDGAVLVLEGPAGIGKTALLAEARDIGARSGLRVLAGRATELETRYPHGLVRRLFERLLMQATDEDAARWFDGPAALARQTVLGAAGGPTLAQFAAHDALFWLLVNLADDGPLLLVVDDLHWADVPSLRFLAHLAERMHDLPLALVGATRRADRERAALVAAVVGGGRGRTARPSALSPRAVSGMLTTTLGHVPGDAVVTDVLEATGGRPFFVQEVGRAIAAGGTPDHPLPDVAAALLGRMALAAPAVRPVAEALAVLGDDATVERLGSLASAEPAAAADALVALAGAGIVTDDGRDFAHPVIRTAVHAAIEPPRRAVMHADAASLLRRHGLGPERIALHLRHVTPTGDPATVETLTAAAEIAAAGGAPEAAVELCRRALAEPPPADRAAGVHALLGRFAEGSGEADVAVEHLTIAAEALAGGVERAELERLLASAQGKAGDYAAAAKTYADALARLPAGPETAEIAAWIEGELVQAVASHRSTPEASALIGALARRAAAGEDLHIAQVAAAAMALTVTTPPASLGGGLAAARITDAPSYMRRNSLAIGGIGQALQFSGRLDDASAFCGWFIDESVETGQPFGVAWGKALRAQVRLRAGQIREAETDGREALTLLRALSSATGAPAAVAYATAPLAQALVLRGELADAEALLYDEVLMALTPGYPLGVIGLARAQLRLAQGRAADVRSEAELLLVTDRKRRSNPALGAWRGPIALAAAMLGRHDEAQELAREELRLAEVFGVLGPASTSRVAMLAMDGVDAVPAALGHAGACDEQGAPLAAAEIRLAAGRALRQGGDRTAARDVLATALEALEHCGATARVAQAHEELIAAGARPRRAALSGRASLTPSELRVAELAALGRTNREVAQVLFITPRTVEGHLTAVFRKLGITGRDELSRALADT